MNSIQNLLECLGFTAPKNRKVIISLLLAVHLLTHNTELELWEITISILFLQLLRGDKNVEIKYYRFQASIFKL